MNYRREFAVDGVNYATTVVEMNPFSFCGLWYCKDCNVPGTPNQLATSVEEAHRLAKESLDEHHVAIHRRGGESPVST